MANAEMIDLRGQRICAVRLPGTSRARFVDARDVEMTLGDWIVVSTHAGEEAGQVVVAPDQWLNPVEIEHPLPAIRRLGDDEFPGLTRRIERAVDQINPAAEVMRNYAPGTFLCGLRYTLNEDVSVVVFAGVQPEDPDHVINELTSVLGTAVSLEYERSDLPQRGLLGGGTGRPGIRNPDTFRELLEQRFDVLRDPETFAPQGLPRLGSTVQTDQGMGRLVAVEIRHWRATVELETGDEIIVRVDDLREP